MLPSQSQLVLPLLQALKEEGGSARAGIVCDAVAAQLNLLDEEREACARTPGGKTYNILDRAVRWTNQIAKLRGLTESAEYGIWQLTGSAHDKLENARPGVVVLVFENDLGAVLWAESEALESTIDNASIDLIVTSPPYNLLRSKSYEYRKSEEEHVRWLTARAEAWKSLLSPTGSVMLNMADVWVPGQPEMTLWQERVILNMVDRLGYHLCEKLFWHSPSKMPSPAEWVTVRRVRVTPAVESVWWLSKTANPKANNRNVLTPYSDSMKRTLEKGTNAGVRPSGHVVKEGAFSTNNGGSIPHNLLVASHSASNTPYLRRCREAGIQPHPARFPESLPKFAIELTTDPGDTVMDPFGGSLTTAEVCNDLGRHFIVGERNREFIEGGLLRFALPDRSQAA
jgi:site-specific DNA-methyltransferase (cytosine-N4-specific)